MKFDDSNEQDAEEETKSFFSVAPLLFVESTIPPQDKCYVKLSVLSIAPFHQ